MKEKFTKPALEQLYDTLQYMTIDGSHARWEKKDAYDASRRLLTAGDDASLRYATVELRRCLEDIVYEKLTNYGELLPAA